MPRFRRKIDRNSWVAIGDDGATTTARNASVTTGARLDGPPNFGDPVVPQLSPPPTYSQVRSTSRPEIASLMLHRGLQHGTTGSPSNARRSAQPATSSTITNLDDIRHTERHVQLENRLSSVPNYPVFPDAPTTPRRRPSRRRSSVASTNTAGLCMSVSQLPGSEPFDENPMPRLTAEEPCQVLGSHPPVSPLLSPLSPLSPFEASVAQVMTVHRVRIFSSAPQSFIMCPTTHEDCV
jgi:hypothetical protein